MTKADREMVERAKAAWQRVLDMDGSRSQETAAALWAGIYADTLLDTPLATLPDVTGLVEALERIEGYKWPQTAGIHESVHYGEATGREYRVKHHIPKEMAHTALDKVRSIARDALANYREGRNG